MSYVLGVTFAVIAGIFMNLGKGIQKQNVHVLRHGWNVLKPQHKEEFRGWLAGTIMLTLVPVPTSLALWLSGSPALVSAITSIGMVSLVVYALAVLKEPLGTRDGVGVVLVLLGTTFLGATGTEASQRSLEFSFFPFRNAVIGALLVAGAFCGYSLMTKRYHGIIFGFFAGTFVATAMFLGHVAVLVAEGGTMPAVIAQLGTIYPYAAMAVGTTGMLTCQYALFGGRSLEVVPSFNSAVIVVPMYYELGVYGLWPTFPQMAFVLLTVAGVVMLSIGTTGDLEVEDHFDPEHDAGGDEPSEAAAR